MFNSPGLSWAKPADSLELFAGVAAITKAEAKDHVVKKFNRKTITPGIMDNTGLRPFSWATNQGYWGTLSCSKAYS